MATADDISWESSQGIFNLRVAAILTSGSDILLCTIDGLDHWYLPGGRVHLGESTEAALARELSEELGHEFPAGTLALVIENIYRYPPPVVRDVPPVSELPALPRSGGRSLR
jgi:8-oxo-dGTP pyrophosphatase MutT (NUDIX family)